MHGIGRFAPDEQVYMVRHDLHAFNGDFQFLRFFLEKFFESFIYSIDKNLSSVFGSEYYVIAQVVDAV